MAGRRFLPKLGFVPCSIIAGIVFLVIVALAQAIAETHPDAVSDRHHGDEFLSRRAHETGYRRSGSRHRTHHGGLFGLNLDGEGGEDLKPRRARAGDEEVEEVEVVEEIVEVEEDDDEGSDGGEEADEKGSVTATRDTRDDRFDEFPASLAPLGGGGGDSPGPSCDAGDFIEHAEFWGDVVVDGTQNLKTSASRCCEACAKIRSCRIWVWNCLLYTSPSPRDVEESRMPSSA